MCAALFGLIAVCSTIVFSGAAGVAAHLVPHARRAERRADRDTGSGSRSARRRPARRRASRRARRRAPGRWRAAPFAACARAETRRDREIAERAVRRHFDGERRHLGEAELAANAVGDRVVHVALNGSDHGLGDTITFVTLKRLEVCVVGRRVHVGEQPWRSPNRSISSASTTRTRTSSSSSIIRSAGRETARQRLQARARVDGAQRMIAAFGPRHDGIGVASQASRCQRTRRSRTACRRRHDHSVVPRGGHRERARRPAVRIPESRSSSGPTIRMSSVISDSSRSDGRESSGRRRRARSCRGRRTGRRPPARIAALHGL